MGYKMKGSSFYPNIPRSYHGYRKGHTPSESKIIPGGEDGTNISMSTSSWHTTNLSIAFTPIKYDSLIDVTAFLNLYNVLADPLELRSSL